MKKLSKIFALVLAFVMLMSVTSFAATLVEGTNGKTIALSFEFSSDNKGANAITEVAAEEAFYLWVNFAGNPNTYDEDTETAPGSIHGVDVVIGYDSEKMTFGTISSQAIAPLTKEAAWDTGVCVFQWGTAKGGIFNSDDEVVVEEGSLVRIKVTAKTALTENDLKAISFLKIANKDSYKAETLLSDDTGALFTITVPDPVTPGPAPFVPETKKGDAIACDNTITFEKEGFITDTYTNVAVAKATLGADVPYSEAGFIWATVDGEDTVTETANKFVATDDDAVSGEGTFAYGVVMYGVPEGVTLKAIPYYVTADPNAAE